MNKTLFMSATEMYPELNDSKNINRYIEFIYQDDLRKFAEECLKHANYQITEYENKVAELTLNYLIRKGLLDSKTQRQVYVDAILIASMLHNVYFDEKKISTSLFKAREEFDYIADKEELYEYGVLPEQFREMIWDTIEGQLGDCTPMSKTKPSPNSPQDLFATCVWIVRNAKEWFYE